MTVKEVILMSATGLLMACNNPIKENNVDKLDQDLSNSVDIEHPELVEESQNLDYLKIIGDSVEIPFFEIELKLSKKAEEKLKTDNETIIVMAYFEGYTDRKNLKVLDILSYPIELTDERLARFENI